jgi:type IX secretion system PorP/SprF family membrane protein
VFVLTANAQQSGIYSQYMFNGLALNPAYAGHDDVLSLTFLGRAQSVGLDGSPKTQTFSAHTPIIGQKVGLGFQLYHETIGVSEQTGTYLSYSYRLNFKNYTLSFGLQTGVNFYNSDYSMLLINDPGDPTFSNDLRETIFNFGSGVMLNNESFFAGLSVPQMLSARNEITQEQPIFFYGGYIWNLSTFIKFKPSALLKVESGRTVELDLNASVLFNDLLWAGVSFRPANALVFMFEFQATEQLAIGYAYDATVNSLRTAESGSHELLINYRFQFSQKGMISPRYF